MNIVIKFLSLSMYWLLTALVLISQAVQAETWVEDDQYIVYYNALNSTFIQPDIAKHYDLVRSRYRGVLNISVQRKQPNGPAKPVTAELKGTVGQFGGSQIPLKFSLVSESSATYYLAQFHFKSGENLQFKVKVKPTPDYPPLVVSFSQPFYSD